MSTIPVILSRNKEETLDSCDPEDISYVIGGLEKSFGLKFNKGAFSHVETFGDLCEVFLSNMGNAHSDGCTSQQAFYKIRAAIRELPHGDNVDIKPDTNLDAVFPRSNRRRQVKIMERKLGVKFHMLSMSGNLSAFYAIALVFFLLIFFFSWVWAVCGIGIVMLAGYVSAQLGTELRFQTVRELTEELLISNYSRMRRMPGTANQHEIVPVIVKAFSRQLAISPAQLTANARFEPVKVTKTYV